jgi:hypothetical protein
MKFGSRSPHRLPPGVKEKMNARKHSGTAIILLSAGVVLFLALAGGCLLPLRDCPRGEGITLLPPPPDDPRYWEMTAEERKNGKFFPCDECKGRGKVSILKRWILEAKDRDLAPDW